MCHKYTNKTIKQSCPICQIKQVATCNSNHRHATVITDCFDHTTCRMSIITLLLYCNLIFMLILRVLLLAQLLSTFSSYCIIFIVWIFQRYVQTFFPYHIGCHRSCESLVLNLIQSYITIVTNAKFCVKRVYQVVSIDVLCQMSRLIVGSTIYHHSWASVLLSNAFATFSVNDLWYLPKGPIKKVLTMLKLCDWLSHLVIFTEKGSMALSEGQMHC